MARSSDSDSWARTPASPTASSRSRRVTASSRPGHGSHGSTGASVPNGMSAPPSTSDAPWVAVRLRPGAPRATSRLGVHPQVDRLDRCGDPAATESRHIEWIGQLDVLEAGRERRPTDRRLEGVEAGSHRAVADGVDLGGDPVRRRSVGELGQPLGRREEQAERSGRRRRSIGLGLEGLAASPRCAMRASRRRTASSSRPSPGRDRPQACRPSAGHDGSPSRGPLP